MAIPPTAEDPARVCFVCLGNICRSPLAEGVFIHLARQRGVLDLFVVDSCGTGGWHAGDKADPRSRAVAKKHGVALPSRARKFDPRRDIEGFDLLIAMDEHNLDDLLELGVPETRVRLMLDYHPGAPVREVPDPYYGGPDGFDHVYELVLEACRGLLVDLVGKR